MALSSGWSRWTISIILVLVCIELITPITSAQAATNFSLVVTPSPLVATLLPGKTTQLQLKIFNNSPATEALQIAPSSFTINNSTGQIHLNNSPPAISAWIKFSAPKFSLNVGQWLTEQVQIQTPANAGFSYSLALVISDQNAYKLKSSGQVYRGSLAVFTLLNVNCPGAIRSLKLESFSANKNVYEWLPASFTLKFKNTGNTIAQPSGNIFISRSLNSKSPMSALAVNPAGGYILPGSTRSIVAKWSDGFPVYKTLNNVTGPAQQKLVWNWSNLSSFRFGRYNASLVAVYNNGYQDVPLQGHVSFWVIPWKALIVFIILGLLLAYGLWSFILKLRTLLLRHSKHR